MQLGLSAEKRHLVEKQLQKALRPAEILVCAGLSVAIFGIVYKCRCGGLRYDNNSTSMSLVVCMFLFILVAALAAVRKYKEHQPCRTWICLAVVLPCSYAAAIFLGERYWWRDLVSAYTWPDMATYVNIDPDTDRGQSFMDAGTVYFHDGSYVLKTHSIAFRNGHTYCVAPIVRAAPNSTHVTTVNGFALPRGGSVDFWAVGVDCCGESGNEFHCGDADSSYARSGLRTLDELSRSMYLLGVQEWSATTGLPVRHPLFFRWSNDPVTYPDGLLAHGDTVFTVRLVKCFFVSLIAAFGIHMLLQKLRVS